MSDEANIALSMELEEKVKEQVLRIISNNSFTVVQSLSWQLASDENFIREVTRRVGSKMTNVY